MRRAPECVDLDLGEATCQCFARVLAQSCGEKPAVPFGDTLRGRHDLVGRLPRAIDDLRESLAKGAMMIDRRKIQRLEGLFREIVEGAFRSDRAVRHPREQVADALASHTATASSS